MGRKRKPTVLKLLAGTHRSDRDGDPRMEPKTAVLADCPPPPDGLGEHGKEAWLGCLPLMIDAGYFTQLDLRSFERYCRAHDEAAKCDAVLLEEGEYTTGDSGFICQHPAVNQRFKWWDILRRYEGEFWLNPTSRSGKQIMGKARSSIPKRIRSG